MQIFYDDKTWEVADVEVNWKNFFQIDKWIQIKQLKWLIEEIEKDPLEEKREFEEAIKKTGQVI